MTKKKEPLLKKAEVIDYLNIGLSTLDAWLADGDIKCCPKMPKGNIRFDPEYIWSFGDMGFKNNVSSPEVYRMEREHAKDIKVRDEIISKLIRMVRGDYINHTKNINEILVIEEQLGLMESN